MRLAQRQLPVEEGPVTGPRVSSAKTALVNMAAEAPGEMGSGLGASTPAEVEQVRAYLLRVVPALLEEDVLPDMSTFESQVKASESRLKKFIEDPQERAVFVIRTLPAEGGEEEGETAEQTDFKPTYDVCVGLNYRPARSVGVAFIKRGTILEAEKSIRSQLRVMNFSEDSPFETLHSYIRDAVTPYFNSFVTATKKTE